MPIFEFECNNCKNRFETLVKSVNSEVVCPKCESKDLDKMLSVFSSSVKNSNNSHCPSADNCSSMGSPCCSGPGCPLQ